MTPAVREFSARHNVPVKNQTMKYALDTEFIEDGHSLTLLSVGLVAEDGREYYAEVADVDHGRANAWVPANVLTHMRQLPEALKTRQQIRGDLLSFIGDDSPTFWGMVRCVRLGVARATYRRFRHL